MLVGVHLTSPIVLFLYKFVSKSFLYVIMFFLVDQGVLILSIGLCERKVTKCASTAVFKNVLRTFEAEIPEIFKNVQSLPKVRRSYTKRECTRFFFYKNNFIRTTRLKFAQKLRTS